MTPQEIISKTSDFVKETLKGVEGGHDWFHIHRVLVNAQKIAATENVDALVVALGALLHDIADAKFYEGDETVGPRMATKFLTELGVGADIIAQVTHIIENISFKNSLEKGADKEHPMELQVIQDADRLDAIGAIGIARAFNYGGFKNRELYNPEIKPNLTMSKEEYKKSVSPTINHFYEKLLLLKDKFNTQTGKALAEQRHQFMLEYLEQFYTEWGQLD